MNVLIVSEPGVNGVFRYVEALCDFLLSRGARVHLAYSDIRGSDRLPLLVARIAKAGGETLNLRVDSHPSPRDIRALFRLWKFARRIRPEVIHAHSSKAGALARALPLCGIKSIQLYHPHAYRGMQPDAGKLVSIFNLAEAFLGLTGSTINVSADERTFALNRLRIPKTHSLLIPNGVDRARFRPAAAQHKKALRDKFHLPHGVPILGTVCRSSAQKDPLTLYRAFALAHQSCPEAYLFHVGEGELDAELETLIDQLGIRQRVIRLPYLQSPAEAYQAVDGFILTSRYEGFSLAALEALATNLPVIISDAPGTTDIIRLPLSHLWKSPPGDEAGFAENIRSWYGTWQNPRPVNHATIVGKSFDSGAAFERVYDLYQTGSAPTEENNSSRQKCAPQRAINPSTLASLWSRILLTAGCVGIISAVVLTLKKSGDVSFTNLISEKLTFWVNHHGQLRNLFAYALLATPFLLRVPRFYGRLLIAFGLSAFATTMEFTQRLIPTRCFDLADIGLSITGIFSIWATIELFHCFRQTGRSPAFRWRSQTDTLPSAR